MCSPQSSRAAASRLPSPAPRNLLTSSFFVPIVPWPGFGGQALLDIVYQAMRTGARCRGKAKPEGRSCSLEVGARRGAIAAPSPSQEQRGVRLGSALTSFTWGRFSLSRDKVSSVDVSGEPLPPPDHRAVARSSAAGHGVDRSLFGLGTGVKRPTPGRGSGYAECDSLEFRVFTVDPPRPATGSSPAPIAGRRRSARRGPDSAARTQM
jgi:hypothetical protein